jgi:hypothetical protein
MARRRLGGPVSILEIQPPLFRVEPSLGPFSTAALSRASVI